jgi:tetratricopeptide (TPR) repeat protein
VLVLLASCVGLLWLWRRGTQAVTVPVLWGIGSLVLAMHLLPTPIDVVAADRYLYLPLAAWTVALTPALERWIVAQRWRALAPALLMTAYAVAAQRRVEIWSDEVSFWIQFYKQHPNDNSRGAIELGNVYLRGHLFTDALFLFLSAKDGYAVLTARGNAVGVLSALGNEDAAHRMATELASLSPSEPSTILTLAMSDIHLLDFEAARAHLRRALELYPGFPQAQKALEQLPELEQAAKTLATPAQDGSGHRERARFYGQVGRLRDALREWQAAAESGELERADWVECTFYALAVADPKSARWFFEHAQAALGPALDRRLVLAFQHRVETETRLRHAWREIGLGKR